MATKLDALIRSEGIEHWAIADARAADRKQVMAEYRRWIQEKRHGDMHYLETHEPMKYDPENILPGTRSVIVMALSYFTGRNSTPQPSPQPSPSPGTGRISVYALGRDYHKEFGGRLKRIVKRLEESFPGERFRAFTDTAPLHERHYAEQSGLVFTGRNTLSLHRELGSFFFIGEILSSRHFPTLPKQPGAESHCPGGCTRCIDICPTAALESPFRINAAKCISYLTIEHSGPIPEDLRPAMGNWIFGCDLCQDVCPFNIRAKITTTEAFRRPLIASEQNLSAILSLKTHEDFTKLFAGTPVMRAGRVKLIRNTLIAAANSAEHKLLPQIRQLIEDKNDVIADAARWALKQLEDPPPAQRPARFKST